MDRIRQKNSFFLKDLKAREIAFEIFRPLKLLQDEVRINVEKPSESNILPLGTRYFSRLEFFLAHIQVKVP